MSRISAAPAPVDLHLEPNEASDLTAVPAEALPSTYDRGFVTVLDEDVVENAIALLGHRGDDLGDGWEAVRLRLRVVGDTGATEDAEACAFHGGRLYVAGSHYGSKGGPLQPKRAFFARLDQSDLGRAVAGRACALEVARNAFRLHRAVNDALRESAIELMPLSDAAREALIEATIERGKDDGKAWKGRVKRRDRPINVEGIEFRADGSLLLGLRYPVAATGDPLLVELPDVDALFDDPGGVPACGPVWVLGCGGDPDRPLGVRGLHRSSTDELHVLVGNLDAEGKDSVLLEGRPSGAAAHCEHWRARLPVLAAGGPVDAEIVHRLDDLKTVEGIAQAPGEDHFIYVVDRDHNVHLRFLHASGQRLGG